MLKMRKLILPLFVLMMIAPSRLSAQNEPYDQSLKGVPFKDRIYLTGGLGGAFSQDYVYIDVSPLLGYRITQRFSAGAGFTYQYINYKFWNYTSNIVGPRAFARYQLLNFLFAHAEYEHLFLKYRQVDNLGNVTFVNKNVPGLLLGGGITPSIGGSRFYLMVLYNVLEGPYTPYSNPVIRVGFDLGL